MKTNETLNYSEKITKGKTWLKWFLMNFKEKLLWFFKESEKEIDQIAKENMKKYPNITIDQAAGREEVTINWKTWFLNWDGKLWTINWDNEFVTYEKIEKVTKENMKRYPNITEDQAAGREKVTINWKTWFLNWDGELSKAA